MAGLLEGRHIEDKRPRMLFKRLTHVLPQAIYNFGDAAMQLVFVHE